MTRIEKIEYALNQGILVRDDDHEKVIDHKANRFYVESGKYWEYYDPELDSLFGDFTINVSPIDQWQPEAEEPTWTEAEIREAFKFSRLAYQEPSISIENYVDGLIGDIIDNLKEKQS